jgi:hypothetical protein
MFDIEDLVDFSINNGCIGARINLFKPIKGKVLSICIFQNSSDFLTKE